MDWARVAQLCAARFLVAAGPSIKNKPPRLLEPPVPARARTGHFGVTHVVYQIVAI